MERAIGLLFVLAKLAFFQGVFDGGSEACQAVFEQVVGGALFHGLDGDLLADGAADNDEGNVQARLLQQRQRLQGVKGGQVMVG